MAFFDRHPTRLPRASCLRYAVARRVACDFGQSHSHPPVNQSWLVALLETGVPIKFLLVSHVPTDWHTASVRQAQFLGARNASLVG